MHKEFELSPEAEKLIDLVLNTNKNLFVTGKAGTGKSTLLDSIRNLPGQNMVVLAPTGIAAVHVKGETIHSFFKLKPNYELLEAQHMRMDDRMKTKFANLKTILIDEISMLRADILDAIDVFLRRVRSSTDAFGGVRMLFFGDLFQLPPIVAKEDKISFNNKYKTPFFFSAHLFLDKDLFTPGYALETVELTKVYRQSDEDLLHVLNAVREGKTNQNDLDFLNRSVNERFIPPSDLPYIHLVGTNAKAQEINFDKLGELTAPMVEYHSFKRGDISRLQPNDNLIQLKVGAQVMFVNNDAKKRWVNGSIGFVKETKKVFDNQSQEEVEVLIVQMENGKNVEVSPHTWEISKYAFKKGRFVREEIGAFTQIPVKLAWAITIHKSQGKTFNHLIVDLGKGSFAHGQTYVALSRCRSMKNLVLKRPVRMDDIIIHPELSKVLFS